MPEQYQHFKTLIGNKLELKLLPDENVKVAIAMNDKIAGITFPDLKARWILTLDSQAAVSIFINGVTTFSAFTGVDQRSHF